MLHREPQSSKSEFNMFGDEWNLRLLLTELLFPNCFFFLFLQIFTRCHLRSWCKNMLALRVFFVRTFPHSSCRFALHTTSETVISRKTSSQMTFLCPLWIISFQEDFLWVQLNVVGGSVGREGARGCGGGGKAAGEWKHAVRQWERPLLCSYRCL